MARLGAHLMVALWALRREHGASRVTRHPIYMDGWLSNGKEFTWVLKGHHRPTYVYGCRQQGHGLRSNGGEFRLLWWPQRPVSPSGSPLG